MFEQAFPIVIIGENLDGKHAAGRAVQQLAAALGEQGFRVVTGLGYQDARRLARIYHNESSLLISVDDADAVAGQWSALEDLLTVTRRRNTRLPIFLLGDERGVESVPTDVLKHTQAFFQLHEDSPEHLARAIGHSAHLYLEKLLPPMFKALSDYAERGNDTWPRSGHGGGVAFRKSPVGRVFYEFFGENLVLSDLSRPVPELGSPLSGTGAVAAAQRNAARIFGSDRTLFVAGGAGTANRIVWKGTVARDDLVVCDRSSDPSVVHALIQTGAIPIYLQPTRNAHGLIGPVPREQLTPQWVQQSAAAAGRQAAPAGRLRLLALTNSTPDGICYNVDALKNAVGDLVDVLHLDERSLGYAGFHEFYSAHHAMAPPGTPAKRARRAVTCAVQSTHATLAALAPGAMLHFLEASTQPLRFGPIELAAAQETVSPQYAVLASCDVAAAMMEQPAGRAIVEETIEEALAFRRAMAAVRRTSPGPWWFSLWQPPALADYPVAEPSRWRLNASDRWHGFGPALPEDVLLDPVKVTLLTPGHRGSDQAGGTAGVPAAVVTAFLATRGIDVERSGLFSLRVTFSTGLPEGRWSTLITELLGFRDLFERNAPIRDVLPRLANEFPQQYGLLGLKDLCARMHAACGRLVPHGPQDDGYARLPEIAMRPADAHNQYVRGCVEPVELEDVLDRVVATAIVQTPPGIPLVMPGERITRETMALLQYLSRARQFATDCPGFDLGMTGIDVETDGTGRRYLVTCLKK